MPLKDFNLRSNIIKFGFRSSTVTIERKIQLAGISLKGRRSAKRLSLIQMKERLFKLGSCGEDREERYI
jgi:hypothetical protein